MTLRAVALLLACSACLPVAVADAGTKGIWGPLVEPDGVLSAFERYDTIGAKFYNTQLFWDQQAPRRPKSPTSFKDPAYDWRDDLDSGIAEAVEAGIEPVVTLGRSPRWASARSSAIAAPRKVSDWADYVTAAARRFPRVRYWRIWESPNFAGSFQPLTAQVDRNERLTARQRRGPKVYADLLDAAYGALKRANPRNVVIGGNVTTTGSIAPRPYLHALRTSKGKRPRMSFFGFDPQSDRPPYVGELPPSPAGFADFADLPRLFGWLDRDVRRGVRVWIGSYIAPTDDPALQATYLRRALRTVRSSKRIVAFNYRQLRDAPSAPRGLLDAGGKQKPGYAAFRAG